MNCTIAADGRSITCHLCGLTSHNANDVRERYCGRCHVFHGDNQEKQLDTRACPVSISGHSTATRKGICFKATRLD